MPNFTIPKLKDLSLVELKEVGRSLNSKRDEVLSEYKKNADEVQKAITVATKKEHDSRKANDPDYDKKSQVIGRK